MHFVFSLIAFWQGGSSWGLKLWFLLFLNSGFLLILNLCTSNKNNNKTKAFHTIVALYVLSNKVSINISNMFSKYRNDIIHGRLK
jgi:hypothetical protein